MLRTKSIANSSSLPSTVRSSPYELDSAGKNVAARLYNARVVKETIKTVLSDIKAALGLPTDAPASGKAKRSLSDGRREDASFNGSSRLSRDLDNRGSNIVGEGCERDDQSGSDHASSLPSEELEPVSYNITNKSAFLPALTVGGYWSGSESQGEEEDDDRVAGELAHRKNRPGQRTRRQLWERKYGSNAKHLQGGQSGHNKSSWDSRRGATQGRDASKRREGRYSHPQQRTGANLVAKNTISKRDENNQQSSHVPLHPSWEAAKRLKQKMKATHQGAKIVFD